MSARYVPTKEQWISSAMRTRIWRRDEGICQYCGEPATLPQFVHHSHCIDHIIPAFAGGPARAYNLVVACSPCNVKKGRRVWVPRNLAAITGAHPEWRVQIEQRAAAEAPRSERRTASIGTALTPSERKAVDYWVSASGLPISDWLRSVLSAAGVLTLPPSAE